MKLIPLLLTLLPLVAFCGCAGDQQEVNTGADERQKEESSRESLEENTEDVNTSNQMKRIKQEESMKDEQMEDSNTGF